MENNTSVVRFRLTKVTLRDCLASGNTFTGILAKQGSEVNVESCVSSYNGNHGIAAFDGGIIRASHSTATNNTQFGFRNDGTSTFESRENNTVRGNGSETLRHDHADQRNEEWSKSRRVCALSIVDLQA